MNVNFGRQTESSRLEHTRPEQRMEISDVFANEVMHFGGGALPPIVKLLAGAFAPFPSAGDIANRRIEPNVPVVSRRVRNLKTEVRSRSRDIPVAERLAKEMALQVIRHFGLQVFPALRPFFQERVQLLQLNKQMQRAAHFRS